MAVRRPLDPVRELLEGFDGGCHASEYLVGALPARIWRADPPEGEGRTVAAIVAHIQSVRRTFAKMAAHRARRRWIACARRVPKRGRTRIMTGTPSGRRGIYDRVLRASEDTRAIVRYILENPVRSGLVRHPLEYPHIGSDVWRVEELLEGVG